MSDTAVTVAFSIYLGVMLFIVLAQMGIIVPFLLLFCRTHVSREIGEDGWIFEIRYKVLLGRTFIVDTNHYLAPPEHFNCRCTSLSLVSTKPKQKGKTHGET